MAKLSGWSFDWAERGSCLPSFRRLAMSHLLLDTGALKTTEGKAEVPSLDKEGWLRPLRKRREASLAGADGVVCSSHRLSEVEPTTPAAPTKEPSVRFCWWRSHPSFAKKGSSPAPGITCVRASARGEQGATTVYFALLTVVV